MTKFTKPLLAISLLASLVAMSATANAGATISDKRYWPSEVGPSAYRAVSTQHTPHDAFAAIGRMASPGVASAPAEEETCYYVGAPKSSICVVARFLMRSHGRSARPSDVPAGLTRPIAPPDVD